jgi:hypothetical protein
MPYGLEMYASSLLTAIGAWRYTQGIYQFHPETLQELLHTEAQGRLPATLLLHMPEWSLYIDAPTQYWTGFFTFLNYHEKSPTLHFVLNLEDNLCPGPELPLGDWTLEESLNRAYALSKQAHGSTPGWTEIPKEDQHFILQLSSNLLSVVLYLCSEEPDGFTPTSHPSYPHHVRTKKGLRLFPPKQPHIWKMGFDIGEKLVRAKSEPKPKTASDDITFSVISIRKIDQFTSRAFCSDMRKKLNST